jgi:hypothetical protein
MDETAATEVQPVKPADEPVLKTPSDPDSWVTWGLLLAVSGLLLLIAVFILVAYENGPAT